MVPLWRGINICLCCVQWTFNYIWKVGYLHANLPLLYSWDWTLQTLSRSFISKSEQKVIDSPLPILFPFFRNFLQHRIDSITPRPQNVTFVLFSSPILILFYSYTEVLRKNNYQPKIWGCWQMLFSIEHFRSRPV